MRESRRDRRARERWARDMQRALEELDRLDRQYGLGAMPPAETDVTPLGRMPRRRRRPRTRASNRASGRAGFRTRRSHGPVLPGLLVVFVLLVAVVLKSPTAAGEQLRRMVDGIRGRATYAFVLDGPDNRPVSWDPCQPIHYVVNPQGAPANWEDVVDGGIEVVEDASGFDFESDGESTSRDFRRRQITDGRTHPVLIAWADTSEEPELRGQTVGIGGASPAQQGGRIRFVGGLVVLDEAAFARMDDTGQERDEELILAHELGHVLGLDHVDDTGELMNPQYVGQDGFGDGDKRGFEILHDQPCG